MPVFWANENAELSDEDASLLIRLMETKITNMYKNKKSLKVFERVSY